MLDLRIVSGDLTSDEKFKEELERVKAKGYIPSHRAGDTGIGKTLEDELGVEENSVQAADLGTVELKANRKDSNSKITLLTKSPKKRGVNSSVLRKQYGYQTKESLALNPDVKVLHTSVSGKGFNTLNGEPFMKLTPNDDKIYLEHAKDGVLEDVYCFFYKRQVPNSPWSVGLPVHFAVLYFLQASYQALGFFPSNLQN